METSSLNVAECCLNVRTLTHLGAMRPEGVALTGIDTLTRLGRKASELSRSALFAFSGRRRQLGPVALKHVVARELEDLDAGRARVDRAHPLGEQSERGARVARIPPPALVACL